VAVGLALPAVAPGLPCSFMRSSSRSWSVITVKSSATLFTPSSAVTAVVTRFWISFRSGQPATVRATRTLTVPPSTMTLRTMPRSTIERRSSGSSTGRSASMIWSCVGMGASLGAAGERGEWSVELPLPG
jgi:hypothetical protein